MASSASSCGREESLPLTLFDEQVLHRNTGGVQGINLMVCGLVAGGYPRIRPAATNSGPSFRQALRNFTDLDHATRYTEQLVQLATALEG
ncbi:hypothetical protein AB0B25_31340 [Nocardia sp. NPDC049190]|uniref:hypothetical protein n=1 Tax=Nocardia sp. NPDC049190 TaxID=3155650 RepID=UPI0033CA5C0C